MLVILSWAPPIEKPGEGEKIMLSFFRSCVNSYENNNNNNLR